MQQPHSPGTFFFCSDFLTFVQFKFYCSTKFNIVLVCKTIKVMGRLRKNVSAEENLTTTTASRKTLNPLSSSSPFSSAEGYQPWKLQGVLQLVSRTVVNAKLLLLTSVLLELLIIMYTPTYLHYEVLFSSGTFLRSTLRKVFVAH